MMSGPEVSGLSIPKEHLELDETERLAREA